MPWVGLLDIALGLVVLVRPWRPIHRQARDLPRPRNRVGLHVNERHDNLGRTVVGRGAWIVRVYHKPFVDWIWGGAFLMALGGILAVSDRRYRLARASERNKREAVATVPA